RGAPEGNPSLRLGEEDSSTVGDDGGGSNAIVIAPPAPSAGGRRHDERTVGTEAELASGADVADDVALDNDELEMVDERKKRRNSKRVQRKLRRIQEEKEKKVKRKQAIHLLQQHEASATALHLMAPSSTLGQTSSSKQMMQRAKAFVEAGLTPPAALQALLLRERRTGGRGEGSTEGSEEEGGEDSENERVEGLLAWKDERGRARSGGGEGEERGVGEKSEGAVMRGEEGMGGAGEGGNSVGVEMGEMSTEGTRGGEGSIKETDTGGKRDTNRKSSGDEGSRGEGSREEGEVSDSDDGEEGENEGKQHGEELGDEGMVERQGLLGEHEGHRMEDDEAARKEENARDDVIRAEEGEQHQAAESQGAAVEAEQRKQGKKKEGKAQLGGEGDGKAEQGAQAEQKGGKLWVRVERREEIEAQRAGLPVVAMEGEVMEAVGGSNAVLVCGETGSGKTTQVPQVCGGKGEGKCGWGREGVHGEQQCRGCVWQDWVGENYASAPGAWGGAGGCVGVGREVPGVDRASWVGTPHITLAYPWVGSGRGEGNVWWCEAEGRAALPVVAMEGEVMEGEVMEGGVMEGVGSSHAVAALYQAHFDTPQKTSFSPLPILFPSPPFQLPSPSAPLLSPPRFSISLHPHQFLYEAGYGSSLPGGTPGMIAVTQPRRVAVLATAKRIADEMGVTVGREVGYQVRYDRHVAGGTAIKIMTDGILLREVQADLLLRQYSAVVLDEAHERSINTDILVGLLSRIVPLRQKLHEEAKAAGRPSSAPPPLKLIIMSATLRISDFTLNSRLFPAGPPPVVSVPARQFPVTVHFARRTELVDYVRAAEKKVSAIHRKLPPGGVLVFLTGQREVEDLCRKLRKKFPMKVGGQRRGEGGDRGRGGRGSSTGGGRGGGGRGTGGRDGVTGGDGRGGKKMGGEGKTRMGGKGEEVEGEDGGEGEEGGEANGVGAEQQGEPDANLDAIVRLESGGGTEKDGSGRQGEVRDGEAAREGEEAVGGVRDGEEEEAEWEAVVEGGEYEGEEGGDDYEEDEEEDEEEEWETWGLLGGEKCEGGETQQTGAVGEAGAEEVAGTAEMAGGGSGPGNGAFPPGKVEEAGLGGKGERVGPGGMYVLPLYAMLPAAQQLKVFGAVPEGCRLVVVATNVAETSITIPGICYVVDTGRAKVKQHTGGAGLARFTVEWISRASADQRAGRAGRTGPGQCYRLFSSAVFANQFEAFGKAEIERTPIEGVVLQMKAMGIDKVR
ncbi:unnamed protein product, partial [Closterium sp. NIES-53]